MRGLKRRTSRSIQDGMAVVAMNIFTLALHARTGGNSAVADGQNSSDHKGFRMFQAGTEKSDAISTFRQQRWRQKGPYWRRCLSQLRALQLLFQRKKIG
jgi:hypothetical protein